MAAYHAEPRRGDPADEPAAGFVIRRRLPGGDFRRVFARRETLGAVSALIRRCHAAAASEWTVDGVAVDGTASAADIAAVIDRDELEV